MTAIHEYPNHPARLACELCSCEVGTLDTPNWVAYDQDAQTYSLRTGAYRLAAGYRETDVDEPPIQCNIHDGCICHESALRFLRNAYDPV